MAVHSYATLEDGSLFTKFCVFSPKRPSRVGCISVKLQTKLNGSRESNEIYLQSWFSSAQRFGKYVCFAFQIVYHVQNKFICYKIFIKYLYSTVDNAVKSFGRLYPMKCTIPCLLFLHVSLLLILCNNTRELW